MFNATDWHWLNYASIECLWMSKFLVMLAHMRPWTTKKYILEMYTSSESWTNKISIDVWFVKIVSFYSLSYIEWTITLITTRIGQYLSERYNYLNIWNLRVHKKLNIEKIAFKVVQMKFLAMHITNQKCNFDIFTERNLQNIFMEYDLYLIY